MQSSANLFPYMRWILPKLSVEEIWKVKGQTKVKKKKPTYLNTLCSSRSRCSLNAGVTLRKRRSTVFIKPSTKVPKQPTTIDINSQNRTLCCLSNVCLQRCTIFKTWDFSIAPFKSSGVKQLAKLSENSVSHLVSCSSWSTRSAAGSTFSLLAIDSSSSIFSLPATQNTCFSQKSRR